jgi:hypothetical protein
MFDDAVAIDAVYIRQHFPEFWKTHSSFMTSHRRGFGYWVWKPFVILEALKNLPDGWGLGYLDSGCVLNDNPAAKGRLEDYKSYALSRSVWATELVPKPGEDFTNESWCKADALTRLSASNEVRTMNQVQAGILLLANDSVSRKLVKLWGQVSLEEGYRYLDGSPSLEPNAQTFQEHRHDQALFNIIFRQLGLEAIPDETFYPGTWLTEGEKFPIWSPRWTYAAPFNPSGKRPLSVKLETARRLGFRTSFDIALQRVFQKVGPSTRN